MLLMLDAALACAAPVELTEQERLWIAQHPVLRVGVMENLVPFEYMSNGVLQGRPVQYLQYVRDATGLEFTYVPVKTRAARERMLLDGQVDLLSSHFRFRDEPPIEDLTALVYDTTVPIIVTRVDDADIFDLDQLQDKTVVIPDVEYYEQLLRKRAPRATLIKSPQALAMLNTLRDGGADAVVASEAFLMPYLYRQFQGVLEISGVVGSSMLDVNMAVRTDNAMLASIIGKALGSISPSQQNAMYEHWYRDLEVDAPTLWDIASHYLHLLILGMLALIGLCVLVYRGYRQQRQAERNEQEKTMFLAVMGHEIRSPMNAVLAAMELLWHTRLNDQQRHFAHLANSGANMLVRLLDDVLHRPDSGAKALRLTLEATDVIAL
ncbi:transporter substrate-binding domain-containing protein, partial [Pseudomonas lactis]